MTDLTVLQAIGSTEASSFSEFCRGLPSEDMPQNKAEWHSLFLRLDALGKDGFIEITKMQGKIESMILTKVGADRVRASMDQKRGLFGGL